MVASTYGEGDPPDNSQDFYNWIMDETLSSDLLGRVKYTVRKHESLSMCLCSPLCTVLLFAASQVFSLGNKTYQHYQAMGRKLDARLKALGASCVYPRGEGDDDGSLEDDFVAWTKQMWPTVCPLFGTTFSDAGADSGLIAARFTLAPADAAAAKSPLSFTAAGKPDAKTPYLARVLVNQELHRDTSDRSCRHMEFDIAGSGITYSVRALVVCVCGRVCRF